MGTDFFAATFQVRRRFIGKCNGLCFNGNNMNHLRILVVLAIAAFASAAAAQDTNSLRTQIGQFELRTGSVIVKGFSAIGSVQTGGAEIAVRCKETTDVSIGRKLYGLAIDFKGSGVDPERIYIDENEIEPLLSGLNYLVKIGYDATELSGFEASYTTHGGFEVLAHSIRKEGTVQYFVQGNYSPRISLSSVQLTQLQNLISQARKNLDGIKPQK
jgi:hypothetical protein